MTQHSRHDWHPSGSDGAYGAAPVSDDDRTMAIMAHLSTILALVLSAGWLSFVGPLVVWFLYRHKSPFVRQSAAGALNFNLSMWLLTVIGWILVFTIVLFPVGVLLIAAAAIAQIVFHILGALAANRGQGYRYPMRVLTVVH